MRPLFVFTVFVSAALLFSVQPMFAKMILPMLGGTPAVWNTCMVFFQAALLAGYLYAHATVAWLGPSRQAWLHVLLLAITLLILPFGVSTTWLPPGDKNPVQWLLQLLLSTVGLPFVLVSASAPMLQKWFANTRHPDAADPYFLYAASNLGSLAALLGYPTVLEPMLSLADQSFLWTYGYALLIVLTMACAIALQSSSRFAAAKAEREFPRQDSLSVTPSAVQSFGWNSRRQLRWMMLSFIPSSLMLGVTTYISTDIAAFPLLWVIPLALYLLTFVLVFAKKALIPHLFVARRLPFLILASMITIFTNATEPGWLLIPLHLLTFFAAAMVCHGELARDRPPPGYLTNFYLALSIGGALGGVFNALVAPLVFTSVAEYPLAMVLAALLRPSVKFGPETKLKRWLDIGLPVGLAIVAVGLIGGVQKSGLAYGRMQQLIVFGISGVICLSFGYRPIRFGLGVAALMAASMLYTGPYGRVLDAERSFFGVHRVMLDEKAKYKLLFHGSTIHGAQSLDPARRREPLTYFFRNGPIGQIFALREWKVDGARIAVIGLGAGSMLCHGEIGQHFTFYEIDPTVERIARDSGHFSFLEDCAVDFKVVLGDARLTLSRAPDAHYNMIVLDAFSSDAIPVHLLTKEALQLYLEKLNERSVLAFHISNRHLDLKPVVRDLARDAGLVAFVQDDLKITEGDREKRRAASIWVVLARRRSDLRELIGDSRWKSLEGSSNSRVWTDDFSNVLSVFKWP